MTHNEALAKAAKLLRLAQSANPHEAALAAAKAQDIMDRFKLSGADIALDGSAPVENVIHCPQDPLDTDGSARWKGQLGMVIAKLNQCKLYAGPDGYCLIGRPSDMNAVRYLYAWLTKEIDRLAAKGCAGCGRTYWNNFRLGAVETVTARLSAAARETVASVKVEAAAASASAGNTLALALVEKSLATIEKQTQEVEDYGKKVLRLRSRSRSGSRFDSNARAQGRIAGGQISIGARGALGSSLRLS